MIGRSLPPSPQSYQRGLEHLIAGDTRISDIDGTKGRLRYRGYPIEDLVAHTSFEATSYLILHGELPTPDQLRAWGEELRNWRLPPRAAFEALARIPRRAHPLAQYRTMLTVAACHTPESENNSLDAQWRRPARILSWTAALAAAAIRHLSGLEPIEPDDNLGFAANFLSQTLGRPSSKAELRAFEASLIVQAEHGLHAAAFAALVVVSTGADLGSAVLAGMGALSGARHGGANQLAFEMLDSLPSVGKARRWAREALGRGHRFPGFGHRVYGCPDPRVTALEPMVQEVLADHGLEHRWGIYLAVREEVEKALGPKGIYANVDSITGLLYRPLGLPVTAFPIPFCLAIQTGWMAHCLEYLPDGPMIEPGAVYVGPEKSI